MKQILQSYRTGVLEVAEVPAPRVEPGSVLVRTAASLVSLGTERMTIDLARKSLVGKAKDRPDLVEKVVERVARDGVIATGKSVLSKLDSPIPLGYSCVGKIIEVGAGISHLAVGDRVACAGAKIANHAEINLVPRNLCTQVPKDVDDESAAFVTVGAVALQGVRTAQPTLGETFVVIGLGLIGQLASQLLRANGCRVLGVDLDAKKVALARELGATAAVTRSSNVAQAVAELTGGRGADGVLITAATSSNDPVELAGALCRDRARVVVVGAVGMQVPRRPYYDKELSFFQSRSYGPGRYDPSYEEQGVDYPIGYVRWTEQRNMEAFLELCAQGSLKLQPLISHRFDIADAEQAYALISGEAEPMGVVLGYAAQEPLVHSVAVAPPRPRAGSVGVGFIGAGNFAGGTLVPAAAAAGARLVNIASARGFSAKHLAQRHGFERCSTDSAEVIADPAVSAVFIATRHHLHAPQAQAALSAGKHAFVEKPLALNREELEGILAAQKARGALLAVGFNRRFAPLAVELKEHFGARETPLVMHYRINAGPIPAESWVHDPAVGGGRIIGEACHFIDLCSYLAGARATRVYAQGVTARGGARADDNATLSLQFADGSIATIAYVATGDPTVGKERVEVMGAGRWAVLEDFRELQLKSGGKASVRRKWVPDKGHRACVAAFLAAVKSGGPAPIPLADLRATTLATFAAVDSLALGKAFDLDSDRPI